MKPYFYNLELKKSECSFFRNCHDKASFAMAGIYIHICLIGLPPILNTDISFRACLINNRNDGELRYSRQRVTDRGREKRKRERECACVCVCVGVCRCVC